MAVIAPALFRLPPMALLWLCVLLLLAPSTARTQAEKEEEQKAIKMKTTRRACFQRSSRSAASVRLAA